MYETHRPTPADCANPPLLIEFITRTRLRRDRIDDHVAALLVGDPLQRLGQYVEAVVGQSCVHVRFHLKRFLIRRLEGLGFLGGSISQKCRCQDGWKSPDRRSAALMADKS